MKKLVKNIITLFMAVLFVVGSVQVQYFTAAASNTPAVPQNNKAVSVSYNSIKISWSAVSGASGYVLYRYNSSKKTYDSLAVIKTTGYTNTGLVAGTTYTYKTRAYRTVNGKNYYGNPTAAVSAKPVPSVPGSFKAVSASYNSIKISWSAVSGASGYVLYRYNSSKKTYDSLAVIKTTGYTNTGLVAGTTYTYKTRAYRTVNGKNYYGNPTAAVSAKPVPSVPGSFKAATVSNTSVKLSWNTVSGASGYVLYRYNSATKKYDQIKVTTATSFTNTGLAAWGIYSYKVRAYRTVNGTNIYGNPSVSVSNRSELEGVAVERLAFTKKMLNLYDVSSASRSAVYNKIKNFVNRQQIIDYGKTGKGLSVIKFDDGTPALALINCDANTTSAFNTAITEMKAYDANYLKEITANGVVAFMDNGISDGGFNFNKEGLISWYHKDYKACSATFKSPILTESIGIKLLKCGGSLAEYVGIKEILAGECWGNLYAENGDSFCKDMSDGCLLVFKNIYEPMYAPATLESDTIQNLLKKVRDNNLVSSFGSDGTWNKIKKNLPY